MSRERVDQIAHGIVDSDGRVVGAWLDAFLDLQAAGLHWKKAAFVAWDNAPKTTRQPQTMVELAELLHYKSEQVFYKWRKQKWYQELGVEQYRRAIFGRYLADVDRATIGAALNESGSAGVQARKLFYEQMTPPALRIEHSGPDGGPIETRTAQYDTLSDDELEAALRRALDAGAAFDGAAAAVALDADDGGGAAADDAGGG
jgi:hypothetical protein